MYIYHFVCAFFIPFMACIFAYCDKPSKKALKVKGSSEKNATLDEESKKANESVFLQEFPGYFLNNSLWGMTYTIVGDREIIWLVLYLVFLLLSFAILKIHANKYFHKGIKYCIYIIGFIASILMIFARILGPQFLKTLIFF